MCKFLVREKEMIPATAVTVEAGRIAFMGEIVAKINLSRRNADEAALGRGGLLVADQRIVIIASTPPFASLAFWLAKGRESRGEATDRQGKRIHFIDGLDERIAEVEGDWGCSREGREQRDGECE